MSLDFADVKPSVMNLVLVGLMAVVFIVLIKMLTTRFYIPGITEVVSMV